MPVKPTTTPRAQRTVHPCHSWRPLIADVATTHRLHPRDMLGGWKCPKAVAARQELWWRLNQRGVALSEIGRRLGGFHHTTVMHGVRQWAAKMEAA